MAAASLFIVFFVVALVGVPIAAALVIATAVAASVFYDVNLVMIAQRIFVSMDSFSLMALPFFMIAGSLMSEGGYQNGL